jgi:2-oxoglutarate dehydrogenase E2 component (dihydrolipoamide succinyltransferase)
MEKRTMSVELKVPTVGESITEVEIGDWLRSEGETVERDEPVVVIETEKATVELPAPVSGSVTKILKQRGEKASVGEVIGYMDEGEARQQTTPGKAPKGAAKEPEVAVEEMKSSSKAEEKIEEPYGGAERGLRVMPAARRELAERGLEAEQVEATGAGGRLLKEDVVRHVERRREEARSQPSPDAAAREEEVVPMSLLRRRIAERLVAAQQSAALLTTFNEIDMTAVIALRQRHRESFQQKHGIKLGFMSFFVKASIEALKLIPELNAEIRENNVIYRNYYDIGIAVGGGKGLVVPVLRNAERMSFGEIEHAIEDFAHRAQENKLKVEELQGGTFTISNGGVYGSLLSTPIVNPPQSGVLGLHVIQDRPVGRADEVVIRPMMYIALTYDHRIVDGREAVTFVRHIKDLIEDPARILLEA